MYKNLKRLIIRLLPEMILQKIKKIYYAHALRHFSENEEHDLRVIKYLVNPGEFVIDIGANIGVYTKFLSKVVNTRGRVYSIEPVPQTFEILCSNIYKLGLHNVEPLNLAISNYNGYAIMEIPLYADGYENFYQSKIIDDKNIIDNNKLLKRFKIEVKTIDSIFSELQHKISFIKCDIEGYELECIKGSGKIIQNSKPIWLIEISDNLDDVNSKAYTLLNEFKKVGYEIYWFDGKKLIKRCFGDKSVNYFFLTQEHFKCYLNNFSTKNR